MPEQLTLLSAERPASPSALQENVKDWMEQVVSCGSILDFLKKCGPDGSYGKMCRGAFRLEEETTSPSFSGNGRNAGIMSHGVCLTLSSSEFPSGAAECSLSDILEDGSIPQRFYLSQKACEGILRRAEKRGKTIPKALKSALIRQADLENGTKA